MRFRSKGAAFALTLVALGLSASAGATAPAPPTMDTSNFACTSSVCEVGPGNVGLAFAAGLNVTGDGVSGPDFGDYFTMKVASGSLPPGLKLSLPSSEWTVTGTPTKAGTYPFTVQFTPTQDAAPNGGPSGTQKLTITIGTGKADRLVLSRAVYIATPRTLQIQGFDANVGATDTVTATSTGRILGTVGDNPAWNDGAILRNLTVSPNPGSITVTDTAGGSATIAVVVAKKY
jgi:hypothetical protein